MNVKVIDVEFNFEDFKSLTPDTEHSFVQEEVGDILKHLLVRLKFSPVSCCSLFDEVLKAVGDYWLRLQFDSRLIGLMDNI